MPNSLWSDLIYIYHDFEHRRCNDFVADKGPAPERHQTKAAERNAARAPKVHNDATPRLFEA